MAHGTGFSQPVLARVDIVDDDQAPSCAADLARRLARTGRRKATIVLWLDEADDTSRADLPGLALVGHLEHALKQWDIAVDLAVATNGGVWWPLLCPDPSCCSGLARPVDSQVAGRVRVHYAVAGYAPLPARSGLADSLATDPQRAARTSRYLAEATEPATTMARRRELVDQVWRVLRPVPQVTGAGRQCHPDRHLDAEQRHQPLWPARPPGGDGAGMLTPEATVRALDDVGVRDALLVRLASDADGCRACWRQGIAVLADVVRAAPSGHVAPAATLLGLAAWLSGDGAFATVAAERALADDPQYRLALLSLELFGSGVGPQQWRASTTSLTEEDCLLKTRAPRRRTRR